MISKELNIGRAGEYITLADLLLKGVQAFDTAQGVEYDVIAQVDGRLIKIQVKTTQKMKLRRQAFNPIYFFHIKRTGKGGVKVYEKGSFDAFALVAIDRREVYYLPFNDNVKTSSICIRDKENKYPNQARGGKLNGLYLQDLTWENLIKKIS